MRLNKVAGLSDYFNRIYDQSISIANKAKPLD